jgi:hypothetical protein
MANQTSQEYRLKTIDARLRRIEISKTLCLGFNLHMTAKRILAKMSDRQIVKMFNDNIDAQYILSDYGNEYKTKGK